MRRTVCCSVLQWVAGSGRHYPVIFKRLSRTRNKNGRRVQHDPFIRDTTRVDWRFHTRKTMCETYRSDITYWCLSDLFARKKYVMCVVLTRKKMWDKWKLTHSYVTRPLLMDLFIGETIIFIRETIVWDKLKWQTLGIHVEEICCSEKKKWDEWKITHSYVTRLMLIDLLTREKVMCEANGSGRHCGWMFKRFVLT